MQYGSHRNNRLICCTHDRSSMVFQLHRALRCWRKTSERRRKSRVRRSKDSLLGSCHSCRPKCREFGKLKGEELGNAYLPHAMFFGCGSKTTCGSVESRPPSQGIHNGKWYLREEETDRSRENIAIYRPKTELSLVTINGWLKCLHLLSSYLILFLGPYFSRWSHRGK